jgi:hypothetical protein
VSRFSRKCGSLDLSQHYGSPKPVTGIALLFFCSLLERDSVQSDREVPTFRLEPAHREIEWGAINWIDLAQDRDQ